MKRIELRGSCFEGRAGRTSVGILSLCAALAACSDNGGSSGPRRIFVDGAAAGAGDGTSWADAYPDVQQALAAAGVGDAIWVVQGSYAPGAAGGDRGATFRLKNGVVLYGGFAGGETDLAERDWELHETILSGDLAGDDGPGFANRSENCYQVVTALHVDASTVLDGFTISGGNADGPGFGPVPESREQGSGINIYFGGPRIQNCTLRDNRAENHGAINDHGDTTTVENCVFRDNYAGLLGAGLYIHHHSQTQAIGCSFFDNETPGEGGGAYSRGGHGAVLVDCLFVGNRANLGAGMYNAVGSSTHVMDCVFEKNFAALGGAGVYADNSSVMVEGCDFTGNVAGVDAKGGGGGGGGSGGGGVWSSGGNVEVRGCTFTANSASFGAGVYNNDFSTALVEDCTFTDNIAREAGGLYALSSAVTTIGCTFVGNVAVGGDFSVGGGVSYYFSEATIRDSFFDGNVAELGGGGLYTEGEQATIDRCVFQRNRTTGIVQGWGGAILNGYFSLPEITNCTFTANSARQGGGIFNLVFSAPRIADCTFAANFADEGGAVYSFADSTPDLSNSVLWGDVPDEIGGIEIAASYSCIAGGYPGRGNFAVDPLFVLTPQVGNDGKWGSEDDVLGDLRLGPGSPGIDGGDNSAVPEGVVLDLDGEPRFADDPLTPDTGVGPAPIVDLGAYEK